MWDLEVNPKFSCGSWRLTQSSRASFGRGPKSNGVNIALISIYAGGTPMVAWWFKSEPACKALISKLKLTFHQAFPKFGWFEANFWLIQSINHVGDIVLRKHHLKIE
eukprot:TRINITY_DN108054_c0_g1_i1.p1 TRINITY_DN108054_c0_g1~~TRINITY_DN108054_c0_g1_i1.p1  ORF type:complete len:107 (-),score=3.88 TRINITY_DN108054_c0_g1_i1:13-333(-)